MTLPVLIHSNAPDSPTGYGNQTGIFVPRFKRAGIPTMVSAYYGGEGRAREWNGTHVLPKGYDMWGNDVLTTHAAAAFGGNPRAGIVITLMDVWVLQPAALKTVNVAHWLPIDHDPAPPAVIQTLREGEGYPICFAQFGVEMLRRQGFDPLYVPHGVDTITLRPFKDYAERAEVRRGVGMPEDAFIIAMVAANKGDYPCRKRFPEAFMAVGQFLRSLPANHPPIVFYVHTEAQGVFQGVNLHELAKDERVAIPDSVLHFPPPYQYQMGFPDDAMRNVYGCADVLLNPAAGEGFGMTPLESQSCGTPVIVTDFSAMPELCGAGWKVSWDWDWTAQKSWQVKPSVSAIVEALHAAYNRRQDWSLREQAREFAMRYDADIVMRDHWLPALDKLEQWVRERNRPQAPVLAGQYTPEFAAQLQQIVSGAATEPSANGHAPSRDDRGRFVRREEEAAP